MLARLGYRIVRGVSPRLLWKAARLWVAPGRRALAAHRRRRRRGEIFPPFLFISLTSACNLQCRGCWIPGGDVRQLAEADVEAIIAASKRQGSRFFTLLGGEPLLYRGLWDLIARHPDCYFQVITNGMYFDEAAVARLIALGNVTPLVSLDGPQPLNDARRGDGVFAATMEGVERLQRAKVLFGVATVVTAQNLDACLCDAYVDEFVRRGATYLWYYGYRAVGASPSPELCLSREQLIEFRRRLLRLRRRHPIVLIDTYWDADGRARCPAAEGLGFHIGPAGSIEPCPPLSAACETVADGPVDATINASEYLRTFQRFVNERTRGCVLLERPQEVAGFLQQQAAVDYSGRDIVAELAAADPHCSHHVEGEEVPEDYWVYRFLKRQLFFGIGGYG